MLFGCRLGGPEVSRNKAESQACEINSCEEACQQALRREDQGPLWGQPHRHEYTASHTRPHTRGSHCPPQLLTC